MHRFAAPATLAEGARDKRVLLHVGRLAHPFYREQIQIAPPGFQYVAGHVDLTDSDMPKRDIAAAGSRSQAVQTRVTRAAVVLSTRAGLVLRRRLVARPDVDLVHSGQQLLRAPGVPYVVDCEDGHVFAFYQRGALSRPWARQALVNAILAEECRAVLPWTNAARSGLLNSLGDLASPQVVAKVRTVLPAIRARVSKPRVRARGPLRLLFVGTSFLGKGGAEALEAIKRARGTHDVELDLVTLMPAEWRARVAAVSGVRLHEKLGPHEVRALYARTDALLFPAHVDTLGWVVFEAQSFAQPVLASSHFSLPELVVDGVSGVIFDSENSLYDTTFRARYPWLNPADYPPEFKAALARPSRAYVDRVAAAIVRLAEDRDLLAQLSEGALARVTTGPLSPARRAATLGDIYSAALH